MNMASEEFCMNDMACLGNIAGKQVSPKYALNIIRDTIQKTLAYPD